VVLFLPGSEADVVHCRSRKAHPFRYQNDGHPWYRVKLDDGRAGWVTDWGTGVRLQVGGEHPAVNLTLLTASGRKLKAYLRKRSRTDGAESDQDVGLVEPSDSIELQDAELGRIRVPWREVASITISAEGSFISTTRGSTHRAESIGITRTKKQVQTGFATYRDVAVEISLWLTTKEADIKLADLKRARLVLVHER